MASVKVLLRKNKVKKNGEIPIYLRIIKDRRTKFISLGISVLESQWDEKNSRVKNSHKNSARYNSFIAHKRAEAEDVVVELETKSKSISSNRIKTKIMGLAPIDFFEYADEFLDKFEKRATFGSYKGVKATVQKLKIYMSNKPLFMDEINVQFLSSYEAYLFNELGNSKNTVHGNFKKIRQILYEAIKEGKFPVEENPFLKFKLKKEPTQRIFLTEQELLAVEELHLATGTKEELIRNMFLFSAYAGGLRISDVLQLRWNNIEQDFLNIQIHKTKEPLKIKLPKKAIDILSVYEHSKSKKDVPVFPLLKIDADNNDSKTIHKAISYATSIINKELKEIAIKASITKPISFHTARHTFATRALRKGVRIEYVSKLLGHSNIKETQVYAKIENKDLEIAIDLMED